MDHRRSIKFLLAALMGAGLAGFGMTAAAVAGTTTDEIKLVSTKPVDGAELTATPSEIVLTFADRLPAIEPIVQLQNEARELQSVGQPIAIQNRTALRVRLLEPLPAGGYTVTWLLRPTNGKEVAGKFEFSLRAPDTTTTAASDTGSEGSGTTGTIKIDTGGLGIPKSSNYSGLLGTLGRVLAFVGLGALAGGLLLIAVSWAEGVEYVLTVRHLWLAWGVAVVGVLLTVGTAASDTKGVSIARGMLPTEWDELLKTTFGKALVIRLVAVIGCAWVAARPERVVDSGTQLMALGIPAIALATYGWNQVSADVSVVAVPAGMVHAMAAAAWFGGAALLTRVVLAGPGEADLVGAVRGFRRIFLVSVLAVLVSGAIQTSIYLGGLGKLASTTYGRIFVLKIVVVTLMAVVATANRQYARQRLARVRHLDARPAARLRQSVRTEVLAGALVYLLVAWLAGTPTPALAAADPVKANKDTYVSEDGTFKADLVFGPKRVGAKVELHFRLREPESIEDGVIRFVPKDGKSPGIEIPILGSPNYGFGPEQGFTFGSSGPWTITIDGTGPDGPLQTISSEFVVNNQDGSAPDSTTPTSAVPTTRATVPADTTDTTSG